MAEVSEYAKEAGNRSMDRMLRTGRFLNGMATFDFALEDTEAILLEMDADPRLPCGACGKDPCESVGPSSEEAPAP